MTGEEYLRLQQQHRIAVGPMGSTRWRAGVIIPTDKPDVFQYEHEEGRGPAEVLEKLAVRLGWIEEGQKGLFEEVKQDG